MRSPWRGRAVALAGLTVVCSAALAAPEPTGPARAADASTSPPPLTQVRVGLLELGLPVPSGEALVRRVHRLATAAERARAPHFPVAGEFNWGQDGARFGASRSGRLHEGHDVFARTGTPLVAVRGGVVLEQGNDGGRGNYVAIHDPRAALTYVYLHMQSPSRVRAGQRVRGGQRVGEVGCTGSCYGDHLHFEIRRGRGTQGAPEDPLPRLQRWAAGAEAVATLPPGAH